MKKTSVFCVFGGLQAVSITLCMGIMLIMARLFYLQIDKKGMRQTLGGRNFLVMAVILPLRGDGYDKNYALLPPEWLKQAITTL